MALDLLTALRTFENSTKCNELSFEKCVHLYLTASKTMFVTHSKVTLKGRNTVKIQEITI